MSPTVTHSPLCHCNSFDEALWLLRALVHEPLYDGVTCGAEPGYQGRGISLVAWTKGLPPVQVHRLVIEKGIPFQSLSARTLVLSKRGVDKTALCAVAEDEQEGKYYSLVQLSYSIKD